MWLALAVGLCLGFRALGSVFFKVSEVLVVSEWIHKNAFLCKRKKYPLLAHWQRTAGHTV